MLMYWLFHSFFEEVHDFAIPVARNLMSHLWIIVHLLVLGKEVVVRSEIGMRRTSAVLQTTTCNYCARDTSSKVLGVKV